MTSTESPPTTGPTPVRRPTPTANPKATTPNWSIGHLPALDGLRGAAVAAVLLYHAGYLTGGYLGVDLFFVLSGFLITSLLLTEHRSTGKVKLSNFWIRRARRLLPALFLLFAGVAVYSWVWARPIDLGSIRTSGLGAVFYVANWQQIIHGTNYWDISLAPSPLQHVWSLAIEEQFYLVWPLVIVAVLGVGGRNRARRVQWFCLELAAVSTALFVGLHAAGYSDNRVYEGTDTRATALLLGAAFAGWRMSNGPLEDDDRWPVIEAVGIVAALVLGAAWIFLHGTSAVLYRGGLPACSVLAVLVVAAATNRRSPVLGKVFTFAPLRALGNISYGLYLWHWPIYLVLNEGRTGFSGLALLALRLIVSLGVALLSYWLLEQPIRHGAMRIPAVKVLAPVGAVLSVVLMLVATTGAVAPAAVNQTAAPVLAGQKVPGAPSLMIVGDSVGNSIAGPMIDDPWSFGVNPINETAIGCELMFKGHQIRTSNGQTGMRADCTATYKADVAKFQPKVVVVFFGGANSGEVQIGGSFVQACAPAFAAEQVRLHEQAIDDLTSSGAKVVLVTIVSTSDTSFFPPPWNENIACYNDGLRAVAKKTGAELLDLDADLCPDGACVTQEDGAPVRPDGLHFNGIGGLVVAHRLVTDALDLAGVEPADTVKTVPAACAPLRHAASPILDLIDQVGTEPRRSSLDRLKFVDLDATAAAAAPRPKADLTVVADNEDAVKDVLQHTTQTKKLTLALFPPKVAVALKDLQGYLDATCTGR